MNVTNRPITLLLSALIMTVLSGCIGTDFIDELIGPDLSKVELSERQFSLVVGDSRQLAATYYDVLGEPAQASLQWTSLNEGVATVNGSGLVTGISTGQTRIVAATMGFSDTALVTVTIDLNAVASVQVTGIPAGNLEVGDSLQLMAEVRNGNGDLLPGKIIEWASSASEIVSVDAAGWIRAIAPGTAQILATSEGISSLAATVTVSAGERTAQFFGLNNYQVSGTATVEAQGTESFLVFGADFQCQSGPGLFVYLSNNQNSVSGGIELGALKATSGAQSYMIPAGVNAANFEYVIIYCKPFGIPFGAARFE